MAGSQKERREPSNEERKRREANALATKRFYALIAMLLAILVMVIASLVLWVITPRPPTEGNLFAVKSVTLEGNTKYLQDAVIGESGVLVGQNIFAVKAKQIEEHLLNTFPYYTDVKVQILRLDEVHISVEETDVVGVMYADGCWIPIGTNGKALDKQEITSDRPKNALYIKGDVHDGEIEVGGVALDQDNAEVLQNLLSAINQCKLSDIIEIDLSDLTDIRMNWRGQLDIYLGNIVNLQHKIAVISKTIPRLLESRGEQVTGALNVSSYSSDALENQAVFTPTSVLESTPPPSKPTTDKTPQNGQEPVSNDEQDNAQGDEDSGESYDDSGYTDTEYSDDSSYDDTEYSTDDSYDDSEYSDESSEGEDGFSDEDYVEE